jgi:hypothetical protein
MTQTKRYAVIDRDGFFRDVTKVYSAHGSLPAAIKTANRYRVDIPGNRAGQSSAMVISHTNGFTKGEKIYSDTIRRQYPVIW